jgi:hypothetical protein
MTALFSFAVNALFAVIAWLWARIADALGFVWSMVVAAIQEVVSGVYALLEPYLGTYLQPAIDAVPWATVWGYCIDVAWILPLREWMVVVLATYAASASIRLVRFVIGWIPTIEG